jgi:hypothetical protein
MKTTGMLVCAGLLQLALGTEAPAAPPPNAFFAALAEAASCDKPWAEEAETLLRQGADPFPADQPYDLFTFIIPDDSPHDKSLSHHFMFSAPEISDTASRMFRMAMRHPKFSSAIARNRLYLELIAARALVRSAGSPENAALWDAIVAAGIDPFKSAFPEELLSGSFPDGVRYLAAYLDAGGDPNARLLRWYMRPAEFGEELPRFALRWGNFAAFRLLIARGGKVPPDAVEVAFDRSSWPVADLGLARTLEVLSLLHGVGADFSGKSMVHRFLGWSYEGICDPESSALQTDVAKVVSWLVEHGAPASWSGAYVGSSSPIMFSLGHLILSARYQYPDPGTCGTLPAVESLLESLMRAGYDLNLPDSRGYGTLHYAVLRGWPLEMVRFLLSRGADPRQKGHDGKRPVQVLEKIQCEADPAYCRELRKLLSARGR